MGQPWGLTGTGPIQEGSQLGSRLDRKARVGKYPKAHIQVHGQPSLGGFLLGHFYLAAFGDG